MYTIGKPVWLNYLVHIFMTITLSECFSLKTHVEEMVPELTEYKGMSSRAKFLPDIGLIIVVKSLHLLRLKERTGWGWDLAHRQDLMFVKLILSTRYWAVVCHDILMKMKINGFLIDRFDFTLIISAAYMIWGSLHLVLKYHLATSHL